MSPPSDDEVAAAEQAARRDVRNLPHLLAVADRLLHAGDGARAVALARLAEDIAPDSFAAARALSGILSVAGPRDEAVLAGQRAVRLRPGDAEARLHLGGLLAADGQWRAACAQLARHVAAPGATATGWRLLSTALNEAGHTVPALRAAERALRLAPHEAEYRVHRACLLGLRGRYGDALEELRAAAAQAPDDARVWRASSAMHEAQGDLPQAVRDAERAASLDRAGPGGPGSREAAAHLARMRDLLGSAVRAADADEAWFLRSETRALRGTGAAARAEPGLPAMAAVQLRVVAALLLREMRTRYGRSRLGYAWAVLEPVGHLLTLGSVFALLNQGAPPVGDSLFLFYLTGLLPFLLFGHLATELMSALSGNAAVLQLPVVKRIDAVLARSLLVLATGVLVGIVALSGAALLGAQGVPADPLTALQAVLAAWLLGTGVGAANLVLSELARSWEILFGALNRLLYFASGIYYSPAAMPEEVRDLLAWNPVLHCVEWFRAGFYAQYEPYWLAPGYALSWAAGALLVGLLAERASRRRILVPA